MAESSLGSFVESVCGEDRLRVEDDLGDGFVRLRSSEAERRQAAQDIRSTEDIVIEMLRNSRDAGARNIFLAVQRDDTARCLVVADDGAGIPAALHERIFEPRVTSKLDTARMDKWGMHGRGMALYSIAVNAEEARVASSAPGLGSALAVTTDLTRLGEKTDQSTFPTFEAQEGGAQAMRGPKNILRTAAEFALEHRRDCSVYCGSFTEIAATLYAFGVATTTAATRAFCDDPTELPVAKRLAAAADPASLAELAADLGLVLSERSARRVMDGQIAPVPSLMDRLASESFAPAPAVRRGRKGAPLGDRRGLVLADDDVAGLKEGVGRLFSELAERYYLDGTVEPEVRVAGDAIRITIPVEKVR
ncbi:MAG: ATP-binding protein [Eggerthellaceae bacterium]|nr:ATP-binding protein [Eggerthellaceae bacterium]